MAEDFLGMPPSLPHLIHRSTVADNRLPENKKNIGRKSFIPLPDLITKAERTMSLFDLQRKCVEELLAEQMSGGISCKLGVEDNSSISHVIFSISCSLVGCGSRRGA